jgi:hypothetical protein
MGQIKDKKKGMGQRQEGKRAKVAGTCVIADGKFQLSGISGMVA